MSAARAAGEIVGAESRQAIPLARAVFNWPKPTGYPHGDKGPMIQVSGRLVGALLSWLSRARPGVLANKGVPWDANGVAWELPGVV